jgi:hypothetical protein
MSLSYRSVRFPHDLFHQGRTVSDAASSGSRACMDKVDLDTSACMNLVSGRNEISMTLAKLGIDIAKHTFEVALVQGEKLRYNTFENAPAGFDALTAWLTRQGVYQSRHRRGDRHPPVGGNGPAGAVPILASSGGVYRPHPEAPRVWEQRTWPLTPVKNRQCPGAQGAVLASHRGVTV